MSPWYGSPLLVEVMLLVGEVVFLLDVGNSLLVKVVLLVGVAWHSIGGGGRGRGEEASSDV